MSNVYGKELNYVYVSLPKTASQAMIQFLREGYGGKVRPPGPVKKDKFVFSVVRNPYERCVSLWLATCTRPRDRYGYTAHGETVESLIRWFVDQGPKKEGLSVGDDLSKTLCDVLGDTALDMVLRFEDLQNEVKKLPFYDRSKGSVPVVNRKSTGGRLSFEEYLLPSTIDAINQWCQKDFEKFGYEMRK